MSAQDEDPPGARRVSTHTADPAEPTRLVEDPAVRADVSAAWALGLLRGAEPYRAPAGRKQRVQLRLGHTPRRHAPLVLRLAVMALVLCGGAAIVSAALGHWPDWMARAYERVVGKPPAGTRADPRARTAPRSGALRGAALRGAALNEAASREAPSREAPSREAPSSDAPPSEMAAPAAEIQTPAPVAPIARAPEPRVQRDAIASRPRRAAVSAALVGEDTSAVSAAMRALRVERNPVRARGLLARYLSEHPNGNLAEEALAMSIEAAIAHHDADVADLASRYLRLYPQGSFHALARQALADAGAVTYYSVTFCVSARLLIRDVLRERLVR